MLPEERQRALRLLTPPVNDISRHLLRRSQCLIATDEICNSTMKQRESFYEGLDAKTVFGTKETRRSKVPFEAEN